MGFLRTASFRGSSRRAGALIGLLLVSGGACGPRAGLKPTAGHGDQAGLVHLRMSWELSGLTVPHSLLANKHQSGPILLAVRPSGPRTADICAIETQAGHVKWCAPLAHPADVALSVVGDHAVAHDSAGHLATYGLATGKVAWMKTLDCEIAAGEIEAVAPGLAIAKCQPLGGARLDAGALLALDLRTGTVVWRRPSPPWREIYVQGTLAILPSLLDELGPLETKGEDFGLGPRPRRPSDVIGAQGSLDAVIDVRTGKSLPPSTLAAAESTGGAATPALVVALFSGELALLQRGAKSARFDRSWNPRPCALRPDRGCISVPATQISSALRAGRAFIVHDCISLKEIDPTFQTELGSWPLSGGIPASEPTVMAVEVMGRRLTIVVGSLSEREAGRVVSFDGERPTLVGRAPALDPDLVDLADGVLVVRSVARSSSNAPGDERDRRSVLRGYSVLEPAREAGEPRRTAPETDKERLRELLQDAGGPELAPVPRRALELVPRWEEHLVALMNDRELRVHRAAFATAATIGSPRLVAALLGWLEPLSPRGERVGSADADSEWWDDRRDQRALMRVSAAEALIDARFVPALKALGRMAQENPVPGFDQVSKSSRFVHRLCSWVQGSTLLEARAVVSDYDRAMDADGAFAALCDDMGN